MNLRYRRLLYLTFFLIFFIAVPILTMYATGYRYNLKRHRLEKTGILAIDSQPKKAMVYLNGEYKDVTPVRLTRLLPNQYQVAVTKEGYYSWSKEVKIASNLTTFFKNIVLFKKNLPISKIEGEINILTIDPNQEKIIYSLVKENSEELRLLNLENDSDFLIESFNLRTYNQLDFVAWSPNQNKILIKQIIGDFNKYLIIDIDTLKIKELFDISRLNFNQIVWDLKNDIYLYGLRNKVLHKIDLVNNLTQPLLSNHITDFQVKGEEIYYLTKIGQESFLNQRILDEQAEIKKKKIKLPSPSDFSLQSSPTDLLVLLDKKNNDLFIINLKAFTSENIETEIILQAKAKDIFWSKDSKKLIYYTDFELWLYDFTKNQSELINRYGKIINQAIWYPGNKYIIYQTQDSIQTTEIAKGIKNDITLVKLEQVNKITVDKKGQNIYFLGKIGNQQGIFQLAIQ